MATLNIEYGKETVKRTRSVYFVLQHKGAKRRIKTGIVLDSKRVLPDGRIKGAVEAVAVRKRFNGLSERLDDIEMRYGTSDMDIDSIADMLSPKRKHLNFFEFAEEWLDETSIKGKANYRTFLNSLERYLGRRFLNINAITFSLLNGYSLYLRDKPRARSLYLGAFRHLFKEAVLRYNDDFETVIENDPFKRFAVPKQAVKKGVRALTLEQLCAIYEYEPVSLRSGLARDCFLMSFCLMGMNSVDMYKCRTLKDGVLKYSRQKTRDRRSDAAYIEVEVHPFCMKIMEKYLDKPKGSDRHVFRFHSQYYDEGTFNAAINKGLKVVGESVGIENLQFYQARHTFATLSRNLMGFAKSDVDEALNHVGSYDIADVYIQKDFSIINENNRKLIDRVFGKYFV